MRVPPGRAYVQRTYVVNNVRYSRVYARYNYRGAPYYRYAPAAYYRPAFYGYAARPWPGPVVFGWGWGGAPWFGFYAGYFAPAPAYPEPSLWLTDFLLAENLKAAYDAQAAAQAQGAPPPPPAEAGGDQGALTPEVKQLIAQEVQARIDEERAAAAGAGAQPVMPVPGPEVPQPAPAPGPIVVPPPADNAAPAAGEELPEALSPKHRVFIVSTPIQVTSDDQECTLTPGDVITRLTDTPDQDNLVRVAVLSSKPGDCASGLQVLATVEELQDMYNSFQERLDSGLSELAKTQGTGGMPAAPDTSTIAGEVPAPPPDQDAEAVLNDEEKAADQSEAELQKEAFIGNAGG
jgi:hypothetical protein